MEPCRPPVYHEGSAATGSRDVVQREGAIDITPIMNAEVINRDAAQVESPAMTVIIPNYRKPDLVRRGLTSLRAAVDAFEDEVEIVTVDDGSGDGAALTLAAEYPWAVFVVLPQNHGYPGAINAGIQASRGEWIFTLNNDTTVDPDVLNALLRAALGRPDIGHLAAQQRFSHDPARLCSAGLVLDRLGVNAERLIGQPIMASETEPTEVFGACGGAAMYRREMVEQLGGFDESFVFGLEDADLAWRAQMRDWRCLYVPNAVVFHDYGGTVPHGTHYRFLQAGRNRVRLVIKNADRRTLLRYGPLMVLYDLAYVAYALVVHRTFAPIRGRLEVLRQWQTVRRTGAAGRQPIDLAPILGIRAALRRRSAWLLKYARAACPERRYRAS
jgi:GT2 family glycosyltransferase